MKMTPLRVLYHCSVHVFLVSKLVPSFLKRVNHTIVENQAAICGKIRSSNSEIYQCVRCNEGKTIKMLLRGQI